MKNYFFKFVIVFSLFVSLFLFFSCATANNNNSSNSFVEIEYEEKDLKATVQGSTLKVFIEGNPTTGYSWEYVDSQENNKVLMFSDSVYVPDNVSGNLVGAGGTFEFTFNAVSKGFADLRFIYKRAWEDKEIDEYVLSASVDEKNQIVIDGIY